MSVANIAVIGTGYIGVEHIKAIAASEAAILHTICSTARSEQHALALKETYGARKTTTRYADVLADADVDVVYLCTPNSQHVSQAVSGLRAGKDLFIEKPMAVSVPHCREIVVAARESGNQVMVGHGARFSRIFQTIHALVRDGTLGEACLVEGDYVHDLKPFLTVPGHDWWMNVADEGQLPIVGGACHPLDLMRWIAGEIVEVTAYGANRNIPQVPWFDTVIAALKFASGAIGKCSISCGADVPYAMNLSFHGTKGSVSKDQLYIGGIPHVEDYMRMPVEVRPEDHTCAEELDHFLSCLATGETPLIDVIEGARTVAVCCAIVKSIETGRPTRVELDF